MAFVENFLIPTTQALITSGLLALIMIGIYFMMTKKFKNLNLKIKLWVKYKVLKKPYNEQIVLWAMDMKEREVKEIDLQREFYQTNKFVLGQFDEAKIIYKKLKGGII